MSAASDEGRIIINVQVGDRADDVAIVEVHGYKNGATAVLALAKCASEEVIEAAIRALTENGSTTEEDILHELDIAQNGPYEDCDNDCDVDICDDACDCECHDVERKR